MASEGRKAQYRIQSAKKAEEERLKGNLSLSFKLWVPKAKKGIYKEIIGKALREIVNKLKKDDENVEDATK